MKIDAQSLNEIIRAGKYLFNRNLAWAGTGNISQVADEDLYLVTASGSRLGFLDDKSIALCRISDNERINDIKPSKEAVVHRSIFINNPSVRSIIHTSPLYTTMLSAAEFGMKVELGYFIESMVMLRNISWVDFMSPGSDELARAIGDASKDSDVIIMRNHGVIATGDNLTKALNKIDTLEFLCHMLVSAKASGINLHPVPKDRIDRFLKESSYKSYNFGK